MKSKFLKVYLQNLFKGYFLVKIRSRFTCEEPKWHQNIKSLMIMVMGVLTTKIGDYTYISNLRKEKSPMDFLKLEQGHPI